MATPAKVKEIAARVREGAKEAGRDPSKIAIIAKSRVSLNPDKTLARAKLRQVLTFCYIADHYSDMLRGMGFDKEVQGRHGRAHR
jgi:alkanesulfonate monooxygenase SsuD/methylene tetrahydromethanopterin reductase-like flavin-dependent oxidoreductase (luciferase family)